MNYDYYQLLTTAIDFITNNINYIGLFVGFIYPAYRRLLADRRGDRREERHDRFVELLNDRMHEMIARGDAATAQQAKLAAENSSLLSENHWLHNRLDTIEKALADNKIQYEELHKLLTEHNKFNKPDDEKGDIEI